MGAVCCGSRTANANEHALVRALPWSDLDLREVLEQGSSVVMLGQRGAGKTLLFLRMIYPAVEVSDLTGIVTETETVHVEWFAFAQQAVLLWDVAGSMIELGAVSVLDAMTISGVFYVVSMLDTAPAAFAQHRKVLERLLASPTAMVRKFLIVFNTFGAFAPLSQECKMVEHELVRGLALERWEHFLGPTRFSYVVGNVKDGLDDAELARAIGLFGMTLHSA